MLVSTKIRLYRTYAVIRGLASVGVKIADHFKIREIPKAKSSTFNQLKFIINSLNHPLGSPIIKISNDFTHPPLNGSRNTRGYAS